jgi:hypothetical protein
MVRSFAFAALAVSLAASTPAAAAVVVWTVNGDFTVAPPASGPVPSLTAFSVRSFSKGVVVSAGTLSGTFTTDEEGGVTSLVGVDLKVSASGDFQAKTFDLGDVDWYSPSQTLRVTDGDFQLEIDFAPGFDPALMQGVALGGWDYDPTDGAGSRMLAGFATPAAAVPEPYAWTLLIGGFGLAGAALRRRRFTSHPA